MGISYELFKILLVPGGNGFVPGKRETETLCSKRRRMVIGTGECKQMRFSFMTY